MFYFRHINLVVARFASFLVPQPRRCGQTSAFLDFVSYPGILRPYELPSVDLAAIQLDPKIAPLDPWLASSAILASSTQLKDLVAAADLSEQLEH